MIPDLSFSNVSFNLICFDKFLRILFFWSVSISSNCDIYTEPLAIKYKYLIYSYSLYNISSFTYFLILQYYIKDIS